MPQSENENSSGRRVGRWISLVLVLLLLAAITDSIVGSRTLVPQGRVLAAQLGDALGRPVVIEGGIRLQLFPQPRFEIMDLRVKNLPGRKSPDMARIAFVDLQLSLAALLKLNLDVE